MLYAERIRDLIAEVSCGKDKVVGLSDVVVGPTTLLNQKSIVGLPTCVGPKATSVDGSGSQSDLENSVVIGHRKRKAYSSSDNRIQGKAKIGGVWCVLSHTSGMDGQRTDRSNVASDRSPEPAADLTTTLPVLRCPEQEEILQPEQNIQEQEGILQPEQNIPEQIPFMFFPVNALIRVLYSCGGSGAPEKNTDDVVMDNESATEGASSSDSSSCSFCSSSKNESEMVN
ncbi:hypothetical protein ACFE04_002845 [Oxalis oulophora]